MPHKLTETELEVLAAKIRSAGQHMSKACDSNGNHVWTAGDPTRTDHFVTAYEEMLQGFYDLQDDHWAKLVHVNG